MAYGSFNFGSSSYGGRRRFILLVSKVFLLAKSQQGLMAEKITLLSYDLRSFITKNTMIIIDILGLAVAARIKAVAREIKVRFRIK